MPTVALSGEFNFQQFSDAGLLAAGYRVYTYAAGTTTFKAAYTDAAGSVAHTYTSDGLGGQYIALNSRGEAPAPLFFQGGSTDVVLKTAAGVTVWTRRAVGPQDADDSLENRLADPTDADDGAGMVALGDPTIDYEFGTVGWRGPRRLGQIVAMMADGQSVNIACYGDSTTDGNATTGWVANPTDGDGDAVGAIDHAATAPNAWPAKLQAILRDAYGNNNIDLWNAGYTSKKMSDGWARLNYDTAVVNNPAYGTPHITFIAFGLNDIGESGSVLADHIEETERLIWQVLGDGSLPILLTCDAIFRTDFSDDRDNKEASRVINAAKFAIAQKFAHYGVECWDIDLAERQWAERNVDYFRWVVEQHDGLHWEDAGHAFKASWMAMRLLRDVVPVLDASPVNLAPYDSRASYAGGTNYGYSNDQTGVTRWYANIRFDAGEYTSEQEMMVAWVWNEMPDCTAIYRHIDNEGSDDRVNSPSVQITEYVTGTDLFDDKVDNTGGEWAAPRRCYDRPSPLCRLAYGLNKVVYRAPPDTAETMFYGWFQFAPGWLPGWDETFFLRRQHSLNALKHTGPLIYRSAGSSGETFRLSEEAPDGSNVIAFGRDDKSCSLFLEMEIEPGMGIAVLGGRGFASDSDPPAPDQYQTLGLLLYRFSTTELRIYHFGVYKDGTPRYASGTPIAAYTSFSGTGLQKFKFKFDRDSGDQRVRMWTDWAETTLAFDETNTEAEDMLPYAGYVGDLWCNTAQTASNGPGLIHVTQAVIQYD